MHLCVPISVCTEKYWDEFSFASAFKGNRIVNISNKKIISFIISPAFKMEEK